MNERVEVYVFGASGHGKVVAEAVLARQEHLLRGFLDDDELRHGDRLLDLPVWAGPEALAQRAGKAALALGVGTNRDRLALLERLVEHGHEVLSVLHPSAVIARGARLGTGMYVGPLAVVHADAEVGRGCIVNSGAVVEHDNVLADGVHVSPNAALGGNVRLGTGVHVGLCAAVLPGVSIGDWAVVGAGAVVTGDVSPGVTVVGAPARPIRTSAQSGVHSR